MDIRTQLTTFTIPYASKFLFPQLMDYQTPFTSLISLNSLLQEICIVEVDFTEARARGRQDFHHDKSNFKLSSQPLYSCLHATQYP